MSRTERIAVLITDAVLIFCGTLAAVCAMPTAYRVSFYAKYLIIAVIPMALLLAAWLGRKGVGMGFGAVFFAGTLITAFVERKLIAAGARLVFSTLAENIGNSKSFEITPEELSLIPDPAAAATWFLAAAAALIALVIAVLLVKGRWLLPSILVPLPFVVAAFIYTNMYPKLWVIMMLMIYVGGVLVGSGLRKAKASSCGLFLAILLPILLILGLVIIKVSPESKYEPIPYEQRREILGNRLGRLRDGILWLSSHNPDECDLKNVGDKADSDDRLLYVSCSVPGTYLLRSHSYGRYSENEWLAAPEYNGEWRSMEALGRRNGRKETMMIFGARLNERYVPYAFEPDPDVKTEESFIRALGNTDYQWTFCPYFTLYQKQSTKEEQKYYDFALDMYTMKGGEEKDALRSVLRKAGISRSSNDYETALKVADFVEKSGVYTLSPGRLPAGKDFVLYFLTENHKGYCVHFASATAALLQAMNIPARYTVGCCVQIMNSGEWVEIPQRLSHAWVEVYVSGCGWLPLESTPGFRFDYTGKNEDPGSNPYVPYNPVDVTEDPDSTHEVETPEPSPTTRPTPRPIESIGPTASVVPTSSPAPAGPGTMKEDRSSLKLLIIPAAAGLWVLVGTLLRSRREKRFRQKDGRKGVMLMLKYHRMLEKLFGAPSLSNAEELANEAVFSQHSMKSQQKELYERICVVRRRLCLESGLRKLIFRWVLFIL